MSPSTYHHTFLALHHVGNIKGVVGDIPSYHKRD